MSAASRRKKPAEPARLPAGEMKTMTGTGECFDGLDHGAGGVEQAAGSAHGDEDALGVLAGGFLEAALKVVGGDGLDGVVNG